MSNIEKTDTSAGLTNEQLLKMVLDANKQLAAALKEQSAAILESRKPYVDPKVVEAKLLALEQRKKDIEAELTRRANTKKYCPHRRTNSDGSFAEKLNIKWMQHSEGIILGVCGTCFSQFDARNPQDMRWLQADTTAYQNMGRARGIKQ